MQGRKQYLEHGLESVIIDILIYIEGREDVERVRKVNFPWDSRITCKDWEEVSGAYDRVHMYNGHDPVPVAVEIGFDNPHTVVRVGAVKGFTKFMNKRT